MQSHADKLANARNSKELVEAIKNLTASEHILQGKILFTINFLEKPIENSSNREKSKYRIRMLCAVSTGLVQISSSGGSTSHMHQISYSR